MIPSDVQTRLLFSLALILTGFALYAVYNWILSRRASSGLLADLGVHSLGTFLIVYFSTPSCAPCKTVQRPALERVVSIMEGAVQVVEIDASQKPDLANRWGVLSAPTTYIVDPHGKIRFINHGIAKTEKLLTQLLVAK